jgi:radical SAM protein with 4Fe4S-binding SPASM domain
MGVPTVSAKKIIDEIANAGAFFLQLDGGEVGYRRDFSNLINHATERGLVMEFFTNGTLFDDDFFKNTNFENVYCVVFSIHSHISSLHDKLTGSDGSFQKAIRNIQRFRDKVNKVVLKMTVTKKNIASLEGLRNLSNQLEVDFAYDIDLLPQTRIPQDSLELGIDDVMSMRAKCPDLFIHKPTKRICIGGRSSCTIDQDGNLFPCRLVNIKLGNVFQKPLVELWNSRLAKDVANRIFSQPAECESCSDLPPFCFYCPGKPYLKVMESNHWVQYNCYLARRKKVLHDG